MRRMEIDGFDGGLAAALATAGLPPVEPAAGTQHYLRFDGDDGRILGYGGLELYGEAALLRSLVVLPQHRGRGHGRAIALALLADARARGARRAFLLTTTAAPLFERLGFRPLARSDAPPAIAASGEFARLCPASAVLMTRATDA